MASNVHPPLLLTAVLSRPFYGLFSIVVAGGLGILYYYLTISIVSVSSIFVMMGTFYVTVSITLTFATAALAGINTSVAVFKIKNSRLIAVKRSGPTTAFGSTLMAFSPGCPACTTPLAAFLSTVGGLALLPLQGLEFKIISVAALAFSTYCLIRQGRRKVCTADKSAGD